MSNTSKVIRLSEINHSVDSLIQFKDLKDTAEDVAAGGALTAGGYGAYKLHKAIRGAGGYKQAGSELKEGYSFGKMGGIDVPLGEAFKGLRKSFKVTPGGSVGGALGVLRSKIHLASKEKPIQFESPSPISPWGGVTGHTSKIDQLEFPAGLSPAAALQFPLPVLMRYLNQRNILQQQFSMKIQKLIELNATLGKVIQFGFAGDFGGETNVAEILKKMVTKRPPIKSQIPPSLGEIISKTRPRPKPAPGGYFDKP